MLVAQNIAWHFAGNYLFDQATFRINRTDKVGLVGRNGAGKSTLLKILSGRLTLSEGSISKEGAVKLGFLEQDLDFQSNRSLWQEVETAFIEIKQIEDRLEKINQSLSERTDYQSQDYEKLLNDLHDLTHRMGIIGGYTYQAQMEQVLLGLGFTADDFHKDIAEFSGGWRMRIALSKLLLQHPDVLLLDEPTNHLDINAIEWLEAYLKQYSGAVVLISHDVAFLNEVTNKILEIDYKRIQTYAFNYNKYLITKEEHKQLLLQSQKNQQKEIKQMESLIEKFRYKPSKAAFAQSLIKKLDKMERIEVPEENRAMHFRIHPNQTPGKVVLQTQGLSKSFDDKLIFANAHMEIERGDSVAFIGQNGQGKSTFSKILVGDLESSQGSFSLGHQVTIGYFAQNQADILDPDKTVLEEATASATEQTRPKVRDMLGSFLFQGDDVYKKVYMLSGGERNRLSLCKLLLQPFNVLIMDEPTNHLDIASKTVLKSALLQFEGTKIIVSHDRDFLKGLVQKVYVFKERKVQLFLGSVEAYLQSQSNQSIRAFEKGDVLENTNPKKTEKQDDKETYQQQKQRKNKLRKIERDIEKLEAKRVALQQEFQSEYHIDKHDAHQKEIKQLSQQLEALYEDWTQLS